MWPSLGLTLRTTGWELRCRWQGDNPQFLSFVGLWSAATDSLDRIVLAGTSSRNDTTQNNFELIRLNINGGIDTAFDGDGRQTIDFSNASDLAIDVQIDSQDRPIAVGITTRFSPEFAVTRLQVNGQRDLAFGTSGIQKFGFGSLTASRALALAIDDSDV